MARKATVCNKCGKPFTDADPRAPKRGVHVRCHAKISLAQYHRRKRVLPGQEARIARYAAAVAAGIPLDEVRKAKG